MLCRGCFRFANVTRWWHAFGGESLRHATCIGSAIQDTTVPCWICVYPVLLASLFDVPVQEVGLLLGIFFFERTLLGILV